MVRKAIAKPAKGRAQTGRKWPKPKCDSALALPHFRISALPRYCKPNIQETYSHSGLIASCIRAVFGDKRSTASILSANKVCIRPNYHPTRLSSRSKEVTSLTNSDPYLINQMHARSSAGNLTETRLDIGGQKLYITFGYLSNVDSTGPALEAVI